MNTPANPNPHPASDEEWEDAFLTLIRSMAKRPGMYVGSKSFFDACNHLFGFCDALQRSKGTTPLDDFATFVFAKYGIFHSAIHHCFIIHFYHREKAMMALHDLLIEYMKVRKEIGFEGLNDLLKREMLARYGTDWGAPEDILSAAEERRRWIESDPYACLESIDLRAPGT